jgi:hypothetical protein
MAEWSSLLAGKQQHSAGSCGVNRPSGVDRRRHMYGLMLLGACMMLAGVEAQHIMLQNRLQLN